MQHLKDTLTIALMQYPLSWENPQANRTFFEEKIKAVSTQTDLMILPEMFTTGFTMNASENAEMMDGSTVQWLRRMAKDSSAAITGSIIVKEHGNFFNRLLFVHPSGKIDHYDKRHLFTLAEEEKTYTAGTHKLIVEYLGWRICPLICYDLRFPVWSRNVENYDLLLYVANWPQMRVTAWDALLKARAIENMCYCVGVNRVGTDGKDFPYSGHSAIYDVFGSQISEDLDEKEGTVLVALQKSHLTENREKFKFLNDSDSFEIRT
ncbi:MAG TPA: amidohydrolase [Flavobacteriaceae bacterium]|nr:amidohydrolase [Flavobacteriaceae bacterium]